ncbi:hypothetical protein GCM10023186_18910 [Hymenobacter koreensis]|uniref:DUF1440 domain-containing protein n=1 Tax=Hymenobacter koreensis TaxID=1084523 RepID=A0ABP8IYQ9_9BACT
MLGVGFVAGSLDILTAIGVYSGLLGRVSPVQLLQSVAAGLLGNAAFQGGTATALLGLACHYAIALSFAAVYVWAYPRIDFLRRRSLISGISYGALAWLLMNLVVVPLSRATQPPFTLQGTAMGLAIVVLMVGMPIALLVPRYYAAGKHQ